MAPARQRVAGAFAAALLCIAPQAAGADAVDLELVLAVDTSASINDYEFRIQMEGYAAAFRHPDVHRAIDRAGDRGIAVAVVQWAGGGQPVLAVKWMLVRDAHGAGRFAERVAATARHDSGDLTAIGDAILFSLARLADNGFESVRRTIDVSADGRSNMGASPGPARDQAVAAGVTVNGLVIMRRAALDFYFKRYVTGGTGSFIERVDDFREVPDAVLRKLIREIEGLPIAHRGPLPLPTRRNRR